MADYDNSFLCLSCIVMGHDYDRYDHRCIMCGAYDPKYVKELQEKAERGEKPK